MKEKLYTVTEKDQELTVAQIVNKVGKTTKPFSYDLNQILYDYTVEVTNRFKGLDLADRIPEESERSS